jgi:hypothetical protein
MDQKPCVPKIAKEKTIRMKKKKTFDDFSLPKPLWYWLRGPFASPFHNKPCSNNITHTQHSPTCCFLCIQGLQDYIVNNPGTTMPIVSLHQENFSVLTNFLMNLQHSSKFPPSPATPSCLQPCLSQSDIEHQYALSLNDKLGSSLRILHSDCHNLSLQLVVPTQYLNTISVTILLPLLA